MTLHHSAHIARHISVQDALEILGISERTLRRWIRDGKVYSSQDKSGFVHLDLDEIEQIAQQRGGGVPPLSKQLAALLQRIEALEAQAQQASEERQQTTAFLQQLVQIQAEGDGQPVLLTDFQLTHRPLHQRRSAPTEPLTKRGLPSGTMRLVDFANRHEIKLSELKRLSMLREIDLEVHQRETVAIRNKQEWWITPPQHVSVITRFQQQGVPYTPCPQCQEVQEETGAEQGKRQ